MTEEYKRPVGRTTYTGAAVRHGRRRNTVNLYTTIAAAITAALGSLLSVNVLFNLAPTRLSVNGVTLYTPQQIQQIGGLVPGQNLVRLNTEFIERRLTENLVYIDKVSVLKDYPDGLIINITEAQPSVQIEYDGGYCTMSKSGRLLEVNETERNSELPLVTGYQLSGYETPAQKEARLEAEEEDPRNAPEKPKVKAGLRAMSDDDQKTAILAELLDKLEKLSFGNIVKIDIKDRTDIKLNYDNRIQIELGSSVELDIKLTYIKAVIDKELPEGYEGTLRYNGVDRGISAIPKKTGVPINVKRPSDSSGTDSRTDSMTDSTAEGAYPYDPNAAYDPNAGYDPNTGYDPYAGYDPNAGYDYGYGYDPNTDTYYNYGYDYGADYGYGYDQGYDQGYGYDYNYDYGGAW